MPGEWIPVDLVVTIPKDHPNDVYITGDVFALMKGKGEGSTVFNVQMQKPFKIFIGDPVIERAVAQEEPTGESRVLTESIAVSDGTISASPTDNPVPNVVSTLTESIAVADGTVLIASGVGRLLTESITISDETVTADFNK